MRVILFLLFFVSSLFSADRITSYSTEVESLTSQFSESVGNAGVPVSYAGYVSRQVNLVLDFNKEAITYPQYVLFVDRNPEIQTAILVFVDPTTSEIILIGANKVSTGNPNRVGHFVTPVGLYKNSTKNFSYRALGTKNSKGWRGFGTKGSRVWDFGWQQTENKKGEPYKIRMLMHATDSTGGEPRLGTIQSKGCVRISAKLNSFLDYFGILDSEYESNKKASYVLPKERKPVNFAGSYVLVVDSRVN